MEAPPIRKEGCLKTRDFRKNWGETPLVCNGFAGDSKGPFPSNPRHRGGRLIARKPKQKGHWPVLLHPPNFFRYILFEWLLARTELGSFALPFLANVVLLPLLLEGVFLTRSFFLSRHRIGYSLLLKGKVSESKSKRLRSYPFSHPWLLFLRHQSQKKILQLAV